MEQDEKRYDVLVCAGTGCVASEGEKVREKLAQAIKDGGLEHKARILRTGCFGFCKLGPLVVVYPDKTFYCQVGEQDVDKIVTQHLQNGQAVQEILYRSPVDQEVQETVDSITFFDHQKRIALQNCGVIDPENIEEYIAVNGYFALYKVLTEYTQEQVIDSISGSGLRGRGGAGFPTGKKWRFTYESLSDAKYIVCNADEGDPGAFMDRSILEGDPHTVIEAMAIAGYAVGSKQGYIYVRAEYPIAVDRLEVAIEDARKQGLLGENILGTGFEFNVELRLGAGAFVCGEETALLSSTVGKRGEPRPRPPFPAVSGLYEKPTLVNNVETFANVPKIILNGAKWYASLGTEKSKGTKVFALAGQINNTGLIEVPMGTTLRTIIYEIGGGIPGDKKFKAVQTGGPSGGCIPEQYLDTAIDYESLNRIGSMMGSGGMIVMDESNCMVDIAKFYVEFSQDESCGKCTPCRIGTRRMLEILRRVTDGEGEMEDLDELVALGDDIKEGSLCGLGQTAPNPVISTLKYFRNEYIAHVKDKRCPAGACEKLRRYRVIPEKCIACGLCAKACGVEAVAGERKKPPYKILDEKCINCGACFEKCPVGAVERG
ncbi:MAG: NADH-quinone oxidoreductase subunit NuoF [Firmicutes bacterium]|nr:NADH-quinone oxidoreductase subunit NuoF [Bacillota bacterium]